MSDGIEMVHGALRRAVGGVLVREGGRHGAKTGRQEETRVLKRQEALPSQCAR